MGNWSELRHDLLRVITSLLPIADAHRFSAVCREWNSVFKERTHPPAAQLPWLVLTDHEITKKRMFYNMSENKYYQFDIPELHGARCYGSSFGWLFVVGPKLEAHLINPFSGAKYSLPWLPPYLTKREYNDEYLIEYADDDLEPFIFSYELMQQICVSKAILSADPNKCVDFVLMVRLNGNHNKLVIWRGGDKNWTVFKENRYIEEFTCFQGQFFALLVNHEFATVDVGPEPKLIDHKTCLPEYTDWAVKYFINVSDISLLLVLRNNVQDENDDDHLITSEFRIFEFDLEQVEAYEIEDMEGDSLFLGKNSGIIVPCSDLEFNGCRENCIYFSSDACVGVPEEKYGYDDMGVWSIVDQTIKPLFQPNVYIPPTSCPIWLLPNPYLLNEVDRSLIHALN